MIYVVDRQDSFTWNVVHQFSKFSEVFCTDYFNLNQNKLDKANIIVLSPGPGSPKDYPMTSKIYQKYKGKKKLLEYVWAINKYYLMKMVRLCSKKIYFMDINLKLK